MSINVTDTMIANAQQAITDQDPYTEKTTQDLLTAVQESLPAYWRLYAEKVKTIEDCSASDRAIIFRGLASDAIQLVTSRHFGFQLHRIGNQIISSALTGSALPMEADESILQAGYPLGMQLIKARIRENQNGGNGTVWNPLGTKDEPEESAHLELLGALSDARLKSWLATQDTTIYFRNCCTTLTAQGNADDALSERVKLFISPAAQILSQDDASKSLHC